MEIVKKNIQMEKPSPAPSAADRSISVTGLRPADGSRPTDGPPPQDGPPKPQLQSALLADTLKLHGFKASPENMHMLNQMLDAGIPLTKENITHMHQAYKMTQNMDKAVFMVQNNILATPKNVSLLNALAEGQVKITSQIETLLNAVSQLPDSPLKDALIKILNTLNTPDAHANDPALDNTAAADKSSGAAKGSGAEWSGAAKGSGDAIKTDGSPAAGSVLPGSTGVKLNLQNMQNTGKAIHAELAENAANAQKPGNTINNMINNKQVPIMPEATSVGPDAKAAFASKAAAAYQSEGDQSLTSQKTTQANGPSTEGAANQLHPDGKTQIKTQVEAELKSGLKTQVESELKAELKAGLKAEANAQNAQIKTQLKTQINSSQISETAIQSNTTQSSEASGPPIDPSLSALRGLSFPLENSSVADLENFINGLRQALAHAQAAASSSSGNPGVARVIQSIRALAEYIDFAQQIKNQIFVQVPIAVGDQQFNTALYVNKDGTIGKNKSKKDGYAALIALDTAFLGHFETYVQKTGQAVRCQFRLEDEEIENLVRANIHKLDAQLKEYRYILESFTFLVGDRPFTLLDALEGDLMDGSALEGEKSSFRSDTVFDEMA